MPPTELSSRCHTLNSTLTGSRDHEWTGRKEGDQVDHPVVLLLQTEGHCHARKGRRAEEGIGGVDKRVQGWGQLLYGQQHPVPAQGVEGIHPSSMDCCFHTSPDAKPKLLWCQEGSQLLLTLPVAILASRRRWVQLNVMGRIPPSFLCRAVRLAM